jgi:hypothetical protein
MKKCSTYVYHNSSKELFVKAMFVRIYQFVVRPYSVLLVNYGQC